MKVPPSTKGSSAARRPLALRAIVSRAYRLTGQLFAGSIAMHAQFCLFFGVNAQVAIIHEDFTPRLMEHLSVSYD